ncbi:Alkaline phosphatase-like alpha/beta/alpha [Penicillium brevicompactum]|uniref:GPI ethanolamine phosphate transferase 2 n=1 Tax=Penicillium brevicompactum TaxID=5074 RepID=A0A9W9RLB7_PENBR|nr:Alkaline phosphatase-like alpha/beta/alpha [Penicillium brevicompactum]
MGFRATVIANLLIPVGILIFCSGFFPYKPLIPGLATLETEDAAPAIFDKVIFMVVDALRSDFVYSNDSGFQFTQSLIRSGAALPFTAYASSPTVTMPRLKAITTGSVPSFLDVILNIAESDTSSTLAYQDTWLAQLKAAGGRLVMYGDDTWLKLFPGMFDRADGTTSFFVSDFTEVDNNVTRHVSDELSQDDWSAFIMHYLGLDHIGHKAGPKSPFMVPKQHEMDNVVNEVYTAIQEEPHLQSTLFVLCGDHGMNEAGNHGGSSAGETSPALLFMSPKFERLGGKESPVEPSGEMKYYQTVEQADIAPTLAGLLGVPIPLNSLGVFIPDFLEMWDQSSHKIRIQYQNAKQLLKTVTTTFPGVSFNPDHIGPCENEATSGIEGAQCAWARTQQILAGAEDDDFHKTASSALSQFSKTAQDVMSRTASNYDVSRLGLGLSVTLIASLFVFPATMRGITRQKLPGSFLTIMILTYALMMFASSYVEEEQQFWYWICSGWIFYLHIKSNTAKECTRSGAWAWFGPCSVLLLAICQRLLRRWNQTGQKFAAEPDIAHTFFGRHPEVFWVLLTLTYIDAGLGLVRKVRLQGVPWLGAMAALLPATLAFTFKVHFAASESPELLEGTFISQIVERWPYSLSLVLHARLVFCGLALIALAALLGGRRSNSANVHSSIHQVLHIFLMTQSRATNVPMFLLFRVTASILSALDLTGMEVTITTLIFQYMTFFAFGGSNAISSVDLASAYNGVGSYNVGLVGFLTFVSNWAGPIWWASENHLLRSKDTAYNASALLTFHVAISTASVMAACTALRTHLFIWTVFSPKYLYSMAWATANHVAVNLLAEIICAWS